MGARSRQGCLPCRRRKKKCDEVKPVCAACQRNCLGCDWPASSLQQERIVNELPPSQQQLEPQFLRAKRLNGLAQIPPQLPSLSVPRPSSFGVHFKKLIHHYIKDTANRIACLQDGENPFLNTVFAAALHDDLLMHAILALSGVHLMQRLPRPTREIQTSTWFNYTRGLKTLRVGLSDGFKAVDGLAPALHALLVVLIFYILKATIGSNFEAMRSHLEGANHLVDYILRTNPSSMQSNIGSCIAEIYVYHASLASFTVHGPDLAILQTNVQAITKIPQYARIGMLSGCAPDIFALIPKVSSLLRVATATKDPHANDRDLIQEYLDLRLPIAEWKSACTNSGAVRCAELYQRTLLLLLDMRFQSYNGETSTRQAFNDLKLLLSDLPPSNPYSTTSTWPLFIFGMIARQRSEVDMVRDYMQSLVNVFGIGLMATTLSYLEMVWKEESRPDILSRLASDEAGIPLIC